MPPRRCVGVDHHPIVAMRTPATPDRHRFCTALPFEPDMRRNLGFAFVHDALGIPVAAGRLYPLTGWLRSPMTAALAMSLSSASVVADALRLRASRRALPGP